MVPRGWWQTEGCWNSLAPQSQRLIVCEMGCFTAGRLESKDAWLEVLACKTFLNVSLQVGSRSVKAYGVMHVNKKSGSP